MDDFEILGEAEAESPTLSDSTKSTEERGTVTLPFVNPMKGAGLAELQNQALHTAP